MSGRTISGTYTTGVALTNSADNPVTLLGSANIASSTGVALQADAATNWTVGNAGTISGYSVGVSLAGSGTLVNGGSIGASQTTGAPGYSYNTTTKSFTPISGGVLVGGGLVSNTGSGTIFGYFEGIVLGGTGSIVNAGSIDTGTAGFGIVLSAAGDVSNAATGILTAGRYGILALGSVAATVTNSGVISSERAVAIDLFAGGSVVNAAGTVSGARHGVAASAAPSTVINQATIIGRYYAGVALFAGGSVSNSALIQGGYYGVAVTGGAGTLTNQGSIFGGPGYGALLVDGGYAGNSQSGTITGGYFGIRITNVAGSVNNLGSISSSRTFTGSGGFDAAGVDLAAGGTLTNGISGNIRATWKGVEIGSLSAQVGGTVFNQGTIYASNAAGSTGAAVWIHGPGLISNAASGTIAGGPFAIVAYYQTTVVNLGSIGGSAYAVDFFPGFADRLIVGPDARFSGLVTGGNTIGSSIVSSLEFASGTTTGTITGLGSQFVGFADISINPDAVWNASGANTLASGVTLTDRGTLLLTDGTLSGAGVARILGTAGGLANATVSGAGAVWTGASAVVIGDQGDGSLAIGNQGTLRTAGNATTDPLQGLAIAAGAVGSVVVSGSKSLLDNTGRFVVGDSGFGALSIEAGGTVITTPGSAAIAGAVIGAHAGADGSHVDVVGAGSNLDATGTLVVGGAATGLLAISGGGLVTADRLEIAVQDGASGIVSVVGKGSALTLTGSLIIGDAASAELSILNGATVTAQDAVIGVGAAATGNVDIEGAGSHLDIAHDLNIGLAGVGVLTLGNNTELTVVNELNIGAAGVLNQFGGIIDPAVVNNTGRAGGKGQISASVSIVNTGTLFAQNGTETLIAPIITGKGVLEIDANGNLAVNVGSVVATQTVTFTDGTGVLTIGTLGGFAATIGSFLEGDEIVVPGTSIVATSYDAGTHVLTLFDPSFAVAGTLQFGASVTNGDTIDVNGVTPCFVAGTRIATERGEVAVEELRVGDRVQVVGLPAGPLPVPRAGRGAGAEGAAQPVVWLGHRTVDCTRHPRPHQVWPVRVAAHAFGPGRPARDLWLSPDHALYVGEVLIPVKHLINGTSIAQVAVDEVTYWHVELPRHAVLLAEGLAAESYLDTGDRANFANHAGPVTLHPDFASRAWDAAGCAPLVVAGPELTAARRWLANSARSVAAEARRQVA